MKDFALIPASLCILAVVVLMSCGTADLVPLGTGPQGPADYCGDPIPGLGTYLIELVVKNEGVLPAVGPCETWGWPIEIESCDPFFVSVETFGYGDFSLPIFGLASGESYPVEGFYPDPSCFNPDCEIRIHADHTDVVFESDETDNIVDVVCPLPTTPGT
jgi:hypothetical protein